MSIENNQASTFYQNYSSFNNAALSYTNSRLLNIREDYELKQNLPRITKHSFNSHSINPCNSYLEKHDDSKEKYRLISRSNKKAFEFKSPITPIVPIQLYNHNHSKSISNKSQFHNTFNRNFYNTKFVYNAFKSNIYVYKEKDNNHNHPSKSNISGIKAYNQFDHTQIGFKRQNEQLYPYQSGALNTKLNLHKTAIDCSITTNNDDTPTRLKRITMKRNHRYSIEKRSATSKAGRDYTGFIKINQDSFIIKDSMINDTPFILMGVFDGHGTFGHHISRAIKEFFDKVDFGLKTTVNDSSITVTTNIDQSILFDDKFSHNYIQNLFHSLTNHIQSIKGINIKLSGSTCVIVLISNEKIICANCGDSRAIIIQENGEVKPLSRDHKPDLLDERRRIEKFGGRIEKSPCFKGLGPYRVWLQNEPYPGLAMSRSIGDQIAKSIGVTAEPEIKEFSLLDLKPKIIVIASDGVWEFLTNNQVANIVIPYYDKGDCVGASKELVDQATKMWENENIKSIDDITAIVAFF